MLRGRYQAGKGRWEGRCTQDPGRFALLGTVADCSEAQGRFHVAVPRRRLPDRAQLVIFVFCSTSLLAGPGWRGKTRGAGAPVFVSSRRRCWLAVGKFWRHSMSRFRRGGAAKIAKNRNDSSLLL